MTLLWAAVSLPAAGTKKEREKAMVNNCDSICTKSLKAQSLTTLNGKACHLPFELKNTFKFPHMFNVKKTANVNSDGRL